VAGSPGNYVRTFKGCQEVALIQWVILVGEWNISVTRRLLEDYANRSLRRACKGG
jgi:hypothetical protein